jgi:hypothetical protein
MIDRKFATDTECMLAHVFLLTKKVRDKMEKVYIGVAVILKLRYLSE